MDQLLHHYGTERHLPEDHDYSRCVADSEKGSDPASKIWRDQSIFVGPDFLGRNTMGHHSIVKIRARVYPIGKSPSIQIQFLDEFKPYALGSWTLVQWEFWNKNWDAINAAVEEAKEYLEEVYQTKEKKFWITAMRNKPRSEQDEKEALALGAAATQAKPFVNKKAKLARLASIVETEADEDE